MRYCVSHFSVISQPCTGQRGGGSFALLGPVSLDAALLAAVARALRRFSYNVSTKERLFYQEDLGHRQSAGHPLERSRSCRHRAHSPAPDIRNRPLVAEEAILLPEWNQCLSLIWFDESLKPVRERWDEDESSVRPLSINLSQH